MGFFSKLFKKGTPITDDFYEEMVKIDKRRIYGSYGFRILAGKDLFFRKNL